MENGLDKKQLITMYKKQNEKQIQENNNHPPLHIYNFTSAAWLFLRANGNERQSCVLEFNKEIDG